MFHEEGDRWKIQVKSRAQDGKVKRQIIDVHTSYVDCKFDKTFTKFVYSKPALICKQFHKVSEDKTVSLTKKATKGIKIVKGT